MRQDRFLSEIKRLVLTLGFIAVWAMPCSTPTRSLAAAPEGPRGTAKWEYGTFTVGRGLNTLLNVHWTTAEDEGKEDSWEAMAKKMKARVKGDKLSAAKYRVAILDLL